MAVRQQSSLLPYRTSLQMLVQVLVLFLLSTTRPSLSFAPSPTRCKPSPCRSIVTLTAASKKRDLSASERERRDEERRRQERAQDVVIGKTSARPEASDFALNVQQTEQEFLRQASDVEQEVYRYTDRGMNAMRMLDLEAAVESFDRVFALRPSAYLWQAGIAKFYLNELEEAAEIFAKSASVFESKFGEPASEERIWRNACELKLLNSLDKKERKRVEGNGGINLAHLPENENTPELLASERRKAIKIARDLFDASIQNDYTSTILSMARLRSVGGAFEEKPRLDIKMWKLNSWFYLGLYYDAMGDDEESKKCMKMSLRLCPSAGNGSDIIHTLPLLHMSRRDWFDDDTFDAEFQLGTPSRKGVATASRSSSTWVLPENKEADPWVAQMVRDGVGKLRLYELREALKVRGLKGTGSKEELQKRLFRSLMEDAGLAP